MTPAQRRHLKSLAHALDPVVRVGQRGVSDAVVAELERALTHHELLKVKLGASDRALRTAMTEELCARTGSECVQNIGAIVVLYRSKSQTSIIQSPD